MEDADIHELDIGDGNALFAVFDGHGGNIFLYGRFLGEWVCEASFREHS